MDYPKFNFDKEQKKEFMGILLGIANIIDTKIKLDIIKKDPDDNMLLESALESKADYIISGDEHLLRLKENASLGIKKQLKKIYVKIVLKHLLDRED